MKKRAGPLFVLLCFLLAGNVFAQLQRIPESFVNGQGARFVLGQTNFSDITFGISQNRWRSTSGIAIAGNALIISDSSYLDPADNNNRVLIYNDLKALKARLPQDDLPLADVVLGQPHFSSFDPGTTARTFNQPVGVASDGTRLFIADWGNNRVLIYNTIPQTNGAAADVVVGQRDFTSADFSTGARGLRRPNSVFSDGSRLMVADTLNNRVLIYSTIPSANGAAADVVLGQPNFDSNRALPTAANTLSSPMSITSDGQHLIVTDLGNNRVLIYNTTTPANGALADVVVGQPDFASNRPGNTQTSLDFPRYAYSDGTRLLIVDSGNNRILIYNQIPTHNGAAADIVIGQHNFLGLMEACAASNLAVPYAVASDGDMLFVSDGFNRRVLGFRPGANLVSSVLNGASFSTAPQTEACGVTLLQPPIAPGGLVAIFGNTLADTAATAPSLPLPYELGGVRVKFNGLDAPLFSVSPTQINAQVPFELAGYSASLEVEKISNTPESLVVSAAVPVGVANGAPGVFTQDGSGKGLGVIVHADGTLVTPDAPAKPGETLTAYATGLGTVTQPQANGVGAIFNAMGAVTIGGVPGEGQTATIVINDAQYSYTMRTGDSLDQVTVNLADIIDKNDPLVSATANIADQEINLLARTPGDEGTELTYSAFVPPGGTLMVTLASPVQVPGNVKFSGTPAAGQFITVKLADTTFTYTPVASDTLETVLKKLADDINNSDPNVMATADVANSRLHLELRDPGSPSSIPYSGTVEPAGSTLVAVTDDPHFTPGFAKVNNDVAAILGQALPLIPGSVLFGGTAEPGHTVTLTLQETPYSYTTIPGDSLRDVVTKVTALLNADPNVTATADLTNLKIDLALKTSGLKITFQAEVSGGNTLIVFPQSNENTNFQSASVSFAGLVGGTVGVYQVSFTVPGDQAANPAARLSLRQNLIVFGSTTQTNIISNAVTFPIQP